MKKTILIYFFLIFSNYHLLIAQTWNLIWSDEFNGLSLDTNKWIHEYGTGSQNGMWGWGNGELQYYQPTNTVISNGIAKLLQSKNLMELLIHGVNFLIIHLQELQQKDCMILNTERYRLKLKLLMERVFGLHFGCYQQAVVGHVMVR